VPIPTPPGGHLYVLFDPLLSPALADEMTAICERLGSYKMYSEEPVHAGFGQGLPARYDAALNFVRSGGRFARQEPLGPVAGVELDRQIDQLKYQQRAIRRQPQQNQFGAR